MFDGAVGSKLFSNYEQMRNSFDSLSLGSGALAIAFVSAIVVLPLAAVRPKLRALWVWSVPLVAAFCLYWSPVWLGADASEYSAWAFIVVVPWFLAGVLSSALVVWILLKLRAR